MKSITNTFFVALISLMNNTGMLFAQELSGSWVYTEVTEEGEVEHLLIFSGNYFSHSVYTKETGAFVSTQGGSYTSQIPSILILYEFHTTDSAQVGSKQAWQYFPRGDEMVLEDGTGNARLWRFADSRDQSPLEGPWLFSGRERDGEIQRRDNSNQPRKTMKLLSNSRFQWIAFNTETKQFFGTGGGTYSLVDNKYVENIGFFSRDDSRVGAALEFQFDIDGNDWHHRGKNSSGEFMYEIWSKRE